MAIATRQAELTWDGSLARGNGVVSTGSGALERLPVTWASRTERPDGRTSPEELVAAAHASCFAMALALVLGEADAPPQQLAVTAACTLDEVDGAPRITSVDLTVRGRVAGIDDKTFERHLAAAGELCPVSNALNGNVQVGLQGHLERQ